MSKRVSAFRSGWARQNQKDLEALRRNGERGIPYGGEDWEQQTARSLGVQSTLRPLGRPRKQQVPQ